MAITVHKPRLKRDQQCPSQCFIRLELKLLVDDDDDDKNNII